MTTAVDVIQNKRDGLENDPEEIRWLVEGAVSGQVPDYQVAAWLMAAYIRGLSKQETMALTRAFVDSGSRLNFAGEGNPPRVDKHSTGGVGDKTSLVIAPLVVSAGLWVPMISGRGLGFTGGTLDKLEALPGFRTTLSLQEFEKQVRQIGIAVAGATRELAPGDQIFYRIRDVSATVESLPLIVASILSKKLAEDLSGLVLDVKVGSGALMKEADQAEKLAQTLVETGSKLGMRVVALLTDMSQPLGRSIGNALETAEAVEVLQGGGPSDLKQVCLELSGWMLFLGGIADSFAAGRARSEDLLESGTPLERFHRMVGAQGGDLNALATGSYLGSPAQYMLRASRDGWIVQADPKLLGRAALCLGAGRKRPGAEIDPEVGILLHKKPGDSVKKGDPMATLYYNRQTLLEDALKMAIPAFQIGAQPIPRPELIQGVVK